MIKVMCAKAELIPAQVPADERVFSYFKGAKRAGVGTIANRWHGSLKGVGFDLQQRFGILYSFALRYVARIYQALEKQVQMAGPGIFSLRLDCAIQISGYR
ncbi:hypothetical protein LNO13_09500 [Klebsiella variicola subsp. variicola]|nr:hypothetical protein [Klebsiella variicola subsp. variicola]